jgi:UDP-N-acetylglucosamine:LPS N-acetylglucosamine transferase
MSPVPPRVLILTASVGEGHDLPARTLADQLHEEDASVEVVTEDGLAVMGRAVAAVSEEAPRIVFYRFAWLWDVGFWVFAQFGPTRRPTQRLLTALGAGGLLRLVAAHRPDVVVSTFPHTTEVLGRLRLAGRLSVPVCAAVTDLSALWYWATPGADLHLVTHPESISEVRDIAGASAQVHAVHGFTAPAFLEPRVEADARRALDLPSDGKIVLVSGGGWGVGDLRAAVETALALEQVRLVVCLCGRNEELRGELVRHFGMTPRVRIEGFTEHMPDWLAAADALVHATAGLTMLEALIRGCPAISFGWGKGHIRMNNAAYRRLGLVAVAESQAQLRAELETALRAARSPDLSYASRPSAASFVLAQIRDRPGGREDDRRNDQDRKGKSEHRPPEGGVAPALAADERGERDGDRDLHREHGGPHA